MIRLVLAETDGKIGEAAKRLKVSRTTLWTRMKALGIKLATDVRKPEH
jgi:transcriptional regulator of acetoin/glycerol metabolism